MNIRASKTYNESYIDGVSLSIYMYVIGLQNQPEADLKIFDPGWDAPGSRIPAIENECKELVRKLKL